MKKKIIIFDKSYLSLKKNLILKNSLNYIFFKKLKYYYKKNIFLNYFFYNNFINLYKKNNLNIYLNHFFYKDLNFFYIYNLNIFKKQFIFNINFLKTIFEKNNIKFLFLKKNLKKSFFLNNCLFINNLDENIKSNNDFLENFFLMKISKKKNDLNYFYFLNFNFFIFNTLELYKILIIVYLNFFKKN